MKERSIKKVIPAFEVNMGGIILDQALPAPGTDQIDPFLLVHHWSNTYEGGQKQNSVGVGPHPHRGFAPVTFIFKGGVHHRDSEGFSEVVYAGGTQWMNSGSGLVHSERPAKEIAEEGGDFEIIQFWINAPAENKMDQPNYQPINKEDTPVFKGADGLSETFVVAGEQGDQKGPINPYSNVLIMRMNFDANAKEEYTIPNTYNSFIYQLDGKIEVAGSTYEGQNLIWLENDGEGVSISATEESRMILLCGEPINEQLSTYGPFVMNTQAEIETAIRDYQSGKMGVLNEVFE